MHRRCSVITAVLCALLGFSSVGRGADVLQNVPHDALGFVVVKNVSATDAKISRLLKTLEVNLPGPLAFLKAATGVSEGLDPQGDFLLVVLPSDDAAEGAPKFGVWLPVRDYDRLVASLAGEPGQRITAVTVAGEDLLIAHQGNWTLVMDPDQRDRIERILAANPNPPAAVAAWKDWINANDVAIVALGGGVRAMLEWAKQGQSELDPHAEPIEVVEDDLFGFDLPIDDDDPFTAPTDPPRTDDVQAVILAAIRRSTAVSPQLAKLVLEADAVACAVRLDADGNAVAGVRIAGSDRQLLEANSGEVEKQSPATLYQGGSFVLHGAGELPPTLSVAAAEFFARSLIDDLKTQERMTLDDVAVARFQQSVEQAAAEVTSAVVLTQAGGKQDGTYTNNFLVVRATDAATFTSRATEAMRQWNEMNRDAEGETRLIFDVEEIKIGDRAATQYSLDIAAVEGAADIPEVRQAMEKLFGPGGKLRLWIVPVDGETVLLAAATPEQVAASLQTLDRKQPVDWNRPEVASTNRLLPEQADWRLFFSPHGYYQWLQRQTDAIVGPVFGGPLVKDFPASPPFGLAGGFRAGELWIDAAAPAETLQGASAHWKDK